jgi:hypothetical protein
MSVASSGLHSDAPPTLEADVPPTPVIPGERDDGVVSDTRETEVGRSAWVGLEIGTARGLARRRPKVDLIPAPEPVERGGLILLAAHTVFPEGDVEILPGVARAEVASGLSGPLRRRFAEYESRFPNTFTQARHPSQDDPLLGMRDELLDAVSGGSDTGAALDIVGQLHLARAVRGTVPIVVGLACLGWYSAYVHAGSSHGALFGDAERLVDQWIRQPPERVDIELLMRELAIGVVGDKPADLLDVAI